MTNMAGPSQEPTPRTVMTKIGNWELGRTLGRGAYAHVRLATHESGHIAACKILPALHSAGRGVVSYDETMDAIEAHKELVMLKAFAGANMPGIVGLEGVISHQGWNFIFLTIYPRSASTMGKLTPDTAVPFFRRLCLSVQNLHSIDVSHEDIKRSNVLATDNAEPILVDFGFAHFTPHGGPVKSLGGTMDYTSPEKMDDDRYYDPYPNDVWSLGILLMKLIGRKHPYLVDNNDSTEAFKRRVRYGFPNWEFSTTSQGPGMIGELAKGMLDSNPSKRYTIVDVLDHPMLRTDIPDPPPFLPPSCSLSKNFTLTDDILIDVAFMGFNMKSFFLCQSLDVIRAKIMSDRPHWTKRWARMLSMWKQREETFWEDVEPEQRSAKARAPRLSWDVVGIESRKSLRPLRAIHLTPQKASPHTTSAVPPPPGFEKLHTPNPKTRQTKQILTPARLNAQKDAKRINSGPNKTVFKPSPRKVTPKRDPVNLRPRKKSDSGEKRIEAMGQPDTESRETLSKKTVIKAKKSSSATLVGSDHPTQYAGGPMRQSGRTRAPMDKENIPPPGEAINRSLKPPGQTAGPLQPLRRSPRLA